MSTLQEYIKKFEQPLDSQSQTFVNRVLSEKNSLISRTFVAPTQAPALLLKEKPFFRFKFKTGEVIDQFWSEKVESAFYPSGIKLDDNLAESLRGGTLLLANMQWPDIQFGKSFTDAAIKEVITERFGNISLISEILQSISDVNGEYVKHPKYQECKSFVQSSINGYGNSLVMQLHYDNRFAYPILVAAVTYFLDVRFSLTLKKALSILRSK